MSVEEGGSPVSVEEGGGESRRRGELMGRDVVREKGGEDGGRERVLLEQCLLRTLLNLALDHSNAAEQI